MYSDNFYNKDISLHNRPPFCSLHHNSGRQLRSCAALKVLLAYYPSIPDRPEEFHNVPSLDHIHIFPDIQKYLWSCPKDIAKTHDRNWLEESLLFLYDSYQNNGQRYWVGSGHLLNRKYFVHSRKFLPDSSFRVSGCWTFSKHRW